MNFLKWIGIYGPISLTVQIITQSMAIATWRDLDLKTMMLAEFVVVQNEPINRFNVSYVISSEGK